MSEPKVEANIVPEIESGVSRSEIAPDLRSESRSEPTTPLMRQYAAVKKEHPTALVFFRLGDFYELFFEDAIVAAKELQITLTSRNKEKGVAIPMCGVPYHAAENYLTRLIRRGFKVAICEQVEEVNANKGLPKALAKKDPGKKLVRREVTRVVTPGTALDSSLAAGENNFLAAVATVSGRTGFAALDLSTGDFRATEFAGDAAMGRVQEELEQLRPKELLYASSAPLFESRYRPETKEASARPLGGRNETGSSETRSPSLKLHPLPPSPLATGRTPRPLAAGAHWAETPLEDWIFSPDHAIPLVENHFGVLSLEGFGLAGRPAAAAAAGAILHYIRATQRGSLDHIDRIGWYERQSALVLDAVTVRNLELIEPLLAGGDARATLLGAIDRTLTPMGRRLLRAWLLRPSIDLEEINSRLDAVEAARKDLITREELRRALDGILDLERLLSRVTLETANPRDLLALGASLGKIPGVKSAVEKMGPRKVSDLPGRWQKLDLELDPLAGLREKITNTLVPEPPLSFADGGVIASGVDRELDELRELSRSGKQVLAQIEQRERARTSIGSLKVKFNSIFGYYMEVSRPNLHLVPADYERRQTLVGAERFTTPELKEYEAKILDAQEKIAAIERRLFTELRQAVAAEARLIRQTALALAQVDVLASLAETAALANYCRPHFEDAIAADAIGEREPSKDPATKANVASAHPLSPNAGIASGFAKNCTLEILQGRHPVLERLEHGVSLAGEGGSGGRFVPNDLYLNSSTHSILLLTGPNMGGKSTYLRQTALIAILAQMGSFVPARAARLPVFDRVFTRIGASDNLARGRSTFMVEMTETAAILHTATPRSLILLDEVGRGTSTYDGLAIAWAAVEYLHERVRAKTLFATHYFELTELASQLAGVKNYHVAVKETAGGIAFLRKVEPGAADRSYGIEVAKLAGLPGEVVERAREVLAGHESAERAARQRIGPEKLGEGKHDRPAQLTIFTPLSEPVVERLREVDLNRLTPLEALNLLAELKRQID